MKDVLNILTIYKSKGIRISLDEKGLNLSIKGNVAGLDDFDKQTLRENKEALLNFLKNQEVMLISSTEVVDGQRLPLSPNQKSIWLHALLEEDSTMYLIPSIYELQIQDLDEFELKKALETLVREHQILSFVFGEQDGAPFQEMNSFEVDKHLFFKDFSQLSSDEKEDSLSEFVQTEMSLGFDIENRPPWSITVFELGDNSYKFFVKIHHLIADGTTLGLLIQELIEAYKAQSTGSEYHNSDLQYHDYVRWITDKENQKQSKSFWTNYLSDRPEDFQFVATSEKSGEGESPIVTKDLSQETKASIQSFLKANSSSISHLFTFAFGIVLSKYGSTNDLILGTPAEGRTNALFGKIIGDLVNTIPLRLKPDYTSSILSELKAFGAKFVSVLDHQMYPLEYILEDINYQKHVNSFPLFNTMISFPNNQGLGKLNSDEIQLDKTTSLYDITLTVIELEDAIRLQIEFDTKKFSSQMITRVLEQITVVLNQIIDQPNKLVSEISLLSDSEQERYLKKGLPKTETTSPFNSVLEAFSANCKKTPDFCAIVENEKRVSYAELDSKAKSVAAQLKINGHLPNGAVAVELPSCVELVASMLGIWMVGGVYVPLGTELPLLRKEEILSDGDIKHTIDQDFFTSIEPDESTETILVSGEDQAYILYTSGSTGKPKGVVISHTALAEKLEDEIRLLKLNELTTLTLTSPTFDVSFLELALPLFQGGTVVIITEKENESVYRQILSNKVSVLQGTPTYFSHFESELDDETAKQLDSTLELLCIGGESLNDSLVRRLKKKLPNVRINNHYGPTEITIDALVKEDISEFKQNSIGQAFGNTGAIIVDAFDNVLPEMVAGELLITGTSLSSGYHNQREQTEEKFTFSEKLGQRVYKTGDLAAWLNSGEVQFIGRKDQQVKYRGYRIELEEISVRLREVDKVEDAFVGIINNVLVAWVVGGSVNSDQIQEQLKSTLPEYMIPTVYEQVSAIPMTVNGKVDENQLPKPQTLGTEYVAPRTELEEQLVAIWQEVLGVERVGVYDNFFELGGHSLKVVSAIDMVWKKAGLKIPFNLIFRRPTIADLLTEIKNVQQDNIKISNTKEAYPLTANQRGIWLGCQVNGFNSLYNVEEEIWVTDRLHEEGLKNAFFYVIERHESLRTIFHQQVDGEVLQSVLPMEELDKNSIVLMAENNLDFDEVYELQFNRPMVRLLILNSEVCRIKIVTHHIICDAWSLNILIDELKSNYLQFIEHGKINSTTLPIQFKDYLNWKQSLDLSKEKSYWHSRLKGELSVLELPSSIKRPLVKTYNGASIQVDIPSNVTTLIRSFVSKQKTTLFMVLISTLKLLFYRYTNNGDIIIGTPTSVRESSDLNDQIGMYLNTLVLRSTIEGEMTFNELFQEVNKTILDAYENQKYEFQSLIEELDSSKNDTSRSPFFDVMIVLQNFVNSAIEVSDTRTAKTITAQYDLTFRFYEKGDGIVLSLEYNTDVFVKEEIIRMIRHYNELVKGYLHNSSAGITSLEYILPEEKSQVLYGFNKTSYSYDLKKSYIDVFEASVDQHKDQVAVVFSGEEITYSELNERANQFANFIIDKTSIDREDLIIVKLEKTDWLIAVLLGVLKLGAAYVPIDPSYPEPRIKQLESLVNGKYLIDSNILEEFQVTKDQYSNTFISPPIPPASLFHIMFTSGSTGTPKGVMLEHKNISKYVQSHTFFPITQATIQLSTVSISFDTTNMEFWTVLGCGGTLVLAKKEELFDYNTLNLLVKRNNVNSLWLTSSWFQQVVDDKIEVFSELDQFISGGDVVSPQHTNKLKLKYPNLTIYNGYGPTENTTFSSVYRVDRKQMSSLPIGKPIDNSRTYILNKKMIPDPVGVIGEIFVAGNGVARGYYQNEELTKLKFFPDPFFPGERMYATGDLGRWNEGGDLEFLGRKDAQIKLFGHRIELDELEEFIRNQKDLVKQAAIGIQELNGERSIVAYFVSKNEQVESKELKARFSQLPVFLRPKGYMQLDQLPVSPNGKLDRKSLPKLTESDLISTSYKAPVTELQKQLIQCVQEIIGVDRVGIEDNFFEIGGSSLRAMQFMAKIKSKLNRAIKLRVLYDYPIILDLANHLELLEIDNAIEPERAPSGFKEFSYAQRQMWNLKVSRNYSVEYNIPVSIQVFGDVDLAILEKTILAVEDRHEILRLRVSEKNSYAFEIDLKSKFQLNFNDLTKEKDSIRMAEGIVRKLERIDFDFYTGPLWDFTVLKIAKSHFVFSLVVHHFIADGWSINKLMNEIFSIYRQLLVSPNHQISPLQYQYKDYTWWQNKLVENQIDSLYVQTWKKEMQQYSSSPFLISKIDNEPAKTNHVSIEIPMSILTEIEENIEYSSLSINDFILTTMSELNEGKPLYFVISSLSRLPQFEGNIGLFRNMLLVRLEYNKELLYIENVKRTQSALLNVMDFEHYPIQALIDAIPELEEHIKALAFNPIVNLMETADKSKIEGIKIKEFISSNDIHTWADVIFHLSNKGKQIIMSSAFNVNKYNDKSVYNYLEKVIETTHKNLEKVIKKGV